MIASCCNLQQLVAAAGGCIPAPGGCQVGCPSHTFRHGMWVRGIPNRGNSKRKLGEPLAWSMSLGGHPGTGRLFRRLPDCPSERVGRSYVTRAYLFPLRRKQLWLKLEVTECCAVTPGALWSLPVTCVLFSKFCAQGLGATECMFQKRPGLRYQRKILLLLLPLTCDRLTEKAWRYSCAEGIRKDSSARYRHCGHCVVTL